MKLLSVGSIKVRDRHGRVWEVSEADAHRRFYELSDYQGSPVRNVALAAETTDGEVLLLPDREKWREGKVYDGVLTHPACGATWRGRA